MTTGTCMLISNTGTCIYVDIITKEQHSYAFFSHSPQYPTTTYDWLTIQSIFRDNSVRATVAHRAAELQHQPQQQPLKLDHQSSVTKHLLLQLVGKSMDYCENRHAACANVHHSRTVVTVVMSTVVMYNVGSIQQSC